MSNISSPDEELQRLQERYHRQTEQFAQQEQALNEQTQLLRRALIRMSKIARGQDAALDAELEKLEALLQQQEWDGAGVAAQLKQVEDCVLKREALPATAPEDRPPADLQRLFAHWDTPDMDANTHAPIPAFAAISEQVCSSLLRMLSQLTLPESSLQRAEEVRERISRGLNWYEFAPAIEDTASLVSAAVGREQREFEKFLKSLDSRLASLQTALVQGQQYQEDKQRSQAELEQVVRAQVSSISDQVRDATDLDSLKYSVQNNLDVISQSLDRFLRREKDREQALTTEIEVLQQRLLTMEQESERVRQRLHEERTKALTDQLTGLPNREAYNDRLYQEYDRWQRYGNPLTLVIGDIDFFKQINDRFGHRAGDKVLQIIAKELRRRIRRTDFVARFGGEEFVMLLPETTLDAALPVLEKVRDMVQRLPFHFQGQAVEITMSFGLCELRQDLSADEVFDQADQALYRAKQAGRNRVEQAA